jgi:hypothetical protein
MRVARISGLVLLLVTALPGIVAGIFAVSLEKFPENAPEWLGARPGTGFLIFGIVSCVVGAIMLALSLALMVWPERALSEKAPLGRAFTRLFRAFRRQRKA